MKTDKTPKVRITHQFRSAGGMVYDLKCEEIRVTISMQSTSEIEWNVEAMAKQTPDPPKVRATGPSRGEALGVLADAWRARNGAFGYPPLDWAAIREALATVQAI